MPYYGIFNGRALNEGITVAGRRVTLKGQTGIWFPAGWTMPVSITTSNKGPYKLDDIGEDGFLTYAYRGTDPDHRDNAGLRNAMRTRTPLVYFKEMDGHGYQAIWPVIVLDDMPDRLCVRAAIDPAYGELKPGIRFGDIAASPLDVRRYAWGQTRHRLHQNAFREMVVSAYDKNILGIDPEYRVHIREDILLERDGPMLKHGLQELDGSSLILPKRAAERPDRERLEVRFAEFRSA